MNIKIVVATHKRYRMPEGGVYCPVQVGAALASEDLGFARDDSGDSISGKNGAFCELTGLYWAWKNLDFDALGLAHYRRLFVRQGLGGKWRRVLRDGEIEALLARGDIWLPKKRHYWIETNYSQYAHAHHAVDLDQTRRIISRRCPEYLDAFDAQMRRTSGHKFNMFIMRGALARRYCEWLFPILFELDEGLDVSTYSKDERRACAFVAERLLDVWLEANHLAYRELPYAFLERQNWLRKGWNFCLRKFRGERISKTEGGRAKR